MGAVRAPMTLYSRLWYLVMIFTTKIKMPYRASQSVTELYTFFYILLIFPVVNYNKTIFYRFFAVEVVKA